MPGVGQVMLPVELRTGKAGIALFITVDVIAVEGIASVTTWASIVMLNLFYFVIDVIVKAVVVYRRLQFVTVTLIQPVKVDGPGCFDIQIRVIQLERGGGVVITVPVQLIHFRS